MDEDAPSSLPHLETEPERVHQWRLHRFYQARGPNGERFADTSVLLLAQSNVEPEQAERLLANGCPPGLALQILM